MSVKKSIEDLGYLGRDSQYSIVKALIEDNRFFDEMYKVVNPNAFNAEPILKQIVGIAKDYYDIHSLHPKWKDIEIILRSKARTEVEVQEAGAWIDALKSEKYLEGMETAKDAALTFFRQQELLKVLNKGIESIGRSGFTERVLNNIQDNLRNITSVEYGDAGQTISEMFDEVAGQSIIERVPTGIQTIDLSMNGGLPKKSLGLLVAKTGAGKTSLGTIMCAGAAKCGYKVVQIFFEERAVDVATKHIAHYTKKYTNDINNTADKNELLQLIHSDPKIEAAFSNNTIIRRMPNGSTTPEDIANYLRHLIATGFKPDMVFIDYFSCLQTSDDRRNMYNNEWKAAEMAMKKLEQMANDLDIALWVAEQTNREGVAKNTAFERMGTIQGSFRIVQPASFFLFLERAGGEDFNKANLYMDKCRGCRPTEWRNINLNNGNLQIDFNDSFEDIPF